MLDLRNVSCAGKLLVLFPSSVQLPENWKGAGRFNFKQEIVQIYICRV
jgi:hypothetical protein